jgi:hypothetical protein
VLGKAEPTPIPEKHAKAALSKYYSFVAATNTLYLGGDVVKENVSSRLPQYHPARTFCTARRGLEAVGGEEEDSSERAAHPTAPSTAWVLRAGGDATAAAGAACALRAKPSMPVGNVQVAVSAATGAGWIRTYGSSGAGVGQRGAVPGPAHGGSLRLPLRTKTHVGRSVSYLLRISKQV